MNQARLFTLIPIIMILNGCAAWVSSESKNGHHRQNRVSIGVHSHVSGKGALGALIVGGIIGAVINQASHESKEKQLEKQNQLEKQKLTEKKLSKKSIEEQQTQINLDRERLNSASQVIHWYQLGKDQKCYKMQTDSGITDVLKSVDAKYCNSKESK